MNPGLQDLIYWQQISADKIKPLLKELVHKLLGGRPRIDLPAYFGSLNHKQLN